MAEIIEIVNSKGQAGQYAVKVPEDVDIYSTSIGALVNEPGITVEVFMRTGGPNYNPSYNWINITNTTITCQGYLPRLYTNNGYCQVRVSDNFTEDITIYFTTVEEPEEGPEIF